MKKSVKITGVLALGMFAMVSCKNNETKTEDESIPMQNQFHAEDTSEAGDKNAQQDLVASYLEIKNALVADNQEAAATAGQKMAGQFNGFDVASYTQEEQAELKDIIVDAREHAEHIGKSEMDHQREHFSTLSKDLADLLAITGTEKQLYQDYCPMYNDGKGAIWLSESKEIKNPYFGSKMLNCGSVQKEI